MAVKKMIAVLLLVVTLVPMVVFAEGCQFPEGMIGTWKIISKQGLATDEMRQLTIPSDMSIGADKNSIQGFCIGGDGSVYYIRYYDNNNSFYQYNVYLSATGKQLILQCYNEINGKYYVTVYEKHE